MQSAQSQNEAPKKQLSSADLFAAGEKLFKEGEYKKALVQFDMAERVAKLNQEHIDAKKYDEYRTAAFENVYQDALTKKKPGDSLFAYTTLTYLQKQNHPKFKNLIEQKLQPYHDLNTVLEVFERDGIDLDAIKRLNTQFGVLLKSDALTEECRARLVNIGDFITAHELFYQNKFKFALAKLDYVIKYFRESPPSESDSHFKMLHMNACEMRNMIEIMETALEFYTSYPPLAPKQSKKYTNDEKALSVLTASHHFFISLVVEIHHNESKAAKLPHPNIYMHCHFFVRAHEAILKNDYDKAHELCLKAKEKFNNNPKLLLLHEIALINIKAKTSNLPPPPFGVDLEKFKEPGPALLLDACKLSTQHETHKKFDKFLHAFVIDFTTKNNTDKFQAFYDHIIQNLIRFIKECVTTYEDNEQILIGHLENPYGSFDSNIYINLAIKIVLKSEFSILLFHIAAWLDDYRIDRNHNGNSFNLTPLLTYMHFDTAIAKLQKREFEASKLSWSMFKMMFIKQMEAATKNATENSPSSLVLPTDNFNFDNAQLVIFNLKVRSCSLSDKQRLEKFLDQCESEYQKLFQAYQNQRQTLQETDQKPIAPIHSYACILNARAMLSYNHYFDFEKISATIKELKSIHNANTHANICMHELYIKLINALIKQIQKNEYYEDIQEFLKSENGNFVSLPSIMTEINGRLDVFRDDLISYLVKDYSNEAAESLKVIEAILGCFADKDRKNIQHLNEVIHAKFYMRAQEVLCHGDLRQVQASLNSVMGMLDDTPNGKTLKILCCSTMIVVKKLQAFLSQREPKVDSERKTAETLDQSLQKKIFGNFISIKLWQADYVTKLHNNMNPASSSFREGLVQHAYMMWRAYQYFDPSKSGDFQSCLERVNQCKKEFRDNPEAYLYSAVIKMLINDRNDPSHGDFLAYEKMTHNGVGEMMNSVLADTPLEIEDFLRLFLNANGTHHLTLVWNTILIKILSTIQKYREKSAENRLLWPDVSIILANNSKNQSINCDDILDLAKPYQEQKEYQGKPIPQAMAVILCVGLWYQNIAWGNNSGLNDLCDITLFLFDKLCQSFDDPLMPSNETYTQLFLKSLALLSDAFVIACSTSNGKNDPLMLRSTKKHSAKQFRSLLQCLREEFCFKNHVEARIILGELKQNLILFIIEKLTTAAKDCKDPTLVRYYTSRVVALGSKLDKKGPTPTPRKNIKHRENKVDDEIVTLDLTPLFQNPINLFKENKIALAAEKFRELCKVITDKFVKPHKNIKLQPLDLKEFNKLIKASKFDELEAKLFNLLSDPLQFKKFISCDPNKFMIFFVEYFDKKLFAHAGVLRVQKNPPLADIVLCYKNITDVSFELKQKADERIKEIETEKAAPADKNKQEKKGESIQANNTTTSQPRKNGKKNKKNQKGKKQPSSTATILQSQTQSAGKVEKQNEPEPKEIEIKSKARKTLPITISAAKTALQKLSAVSYNQRAYIVGGLVCEMITQLGKSTDFDFVFGAVPETKEDKARPEEFIFNLLQRAFPNAVVEKKDKRLYKITYEDTESKSERKQISLDIWWSAALSLPELTNEEALRADTYGGEWAAKPDKCKFANKIKNIAELKQEAPGRDFTMNALYVDAKEDFHDPTEMGDVHLTRVTKLGEGSNQIALPNPHLKCIISAEESFGKDPIRALRAVYFASKRNLDLNDHMKASIATLKPESFANVKPLYRVNIVLKKLFTRGSAESNFELLQETGVLEKLFPSFAKALLNHPVVLNYVLQKLKEADLQYENNGICHIDKIYSTWIVATIMMNRASLHQDYTAVEIKEAQINQLKKSEPFYNEHFNGLADSQSDEKQKLDQELKILAEQKNIGTLQRIIKIQLKKDYDLRFSQVPPEAIPNLVKELKAEEEKIDKETNCEQLIAKRKQQISDIEIGIRTLIQKKRRSENQAIQAAMEEWKAYTGWPKPVAAASTNPSQFSLMPNQQAEAHRELNGNKGLVKLTSP